MIQEILPKKYSTEYRIIQPNDADPVLVVRGTIKRDDKFLLKTENGEMFFPTAGELRKAGYTKEFQFLFSIDDCNYFMLNNGGEQDIALESYQYEVPRYVTTLGPMDRSFAAFTAYHLFYWYRDNTFCGRCGHKTVPFETERALRCPSCGNLIFPKLMPAVIIGLKSGNRLLVSRYAGREYKGIALLAGFCEIGESCEDTVIREIKEEVGLDAKNVTYFGSQPWGMDSNLLMGYFADLDGEDDIKIDEQELAKAQFVAREDLPEDLNLTSLTATMIAAFRDGNIK